MLEAVLASETSFYFNEVIQLYILEGCHLYSHIYFNSTKQAGLVMLYTYIREVHD